MYARNQPLLFCVPLCLDPVWSGEGDGVRQVTQQADEPTVQKQNENNKKRLQGIQQEQFGGENTLEKRNYAVLHLKKKTANKLKIINTL
jgi:hypothetical protein